MPIDPQVFHDYNILTGIGDPSTPLSAAFMTAWAARLADDVNTGLADQAASDAAAYASKFSFNVRDYGALGNDSADDAPAIQAAINAATAAGGGLVFIPAGIYRTTAALTVTAPRVRIEGAGRHNTRLKQTTATNNVLTVAAAAFGFGLSDMWLTRSVTPTTGNGLDVALDGLITYANIHDVYVSEQAKGIRLGPTDYSYLRDCSIVNCQSDGLYLTNSATAGTMQWQINTLFVGNTGGSGIRVASQNIGPPSLTMGNWSGLSTWANAGRGVSIEGLASVPINGVRMQNSFLGEDGDSEVYLNSFGGLHVFSNNFLEGAGTTAVGPLQAIPAPLIGYGMEITVNNLDVSVSGGVIQTNSDSGIANNATRFLATGVTLSNNGYNSNPATSSNCGIFVFAGNAAISGCTFSGQPYGVFANVDSVLVVGNRIAATTQGIGSTVPLVNSVVANNAGVVPVRSVTARRTSGTVTVNSVAAWINVDTATDLVLAAVPGDSIEVAISALWSNEAVVGMLDVVSVVAGAPVNSWAVDGAVIANPATTSGAPGWRGESGVYNGVGGSITRKVTAGDISGGTVTLRLRAATNAAVAKILYGNAQFPLIWSAKNLR